MAFKTHYNLESFEKKFDATGGKRRVETAGYVPAKKRIENMILAGQRLVAHRQDAYDFPDGELDEDFSDPTRAKNFDMADAFQAQLELEHRKKARIKAQKSAEEPVKKDSQKEPPLPAEQKGV